MKFRANKDVLLYAEKPIYSARGVITIENEHNGNALIVSHSRDISDSNGNRQSAIRSEELWRDISCNVLLISKDGQIVWRIENFNYENEPDPYIRATLDDGNWIAYTESGYLKEFDIETGKIINSVYSP